MCKVKIISYKPLKSPMKLDVMVGGKWKRTVSIPCTVGIEYKYEHLKSWVMLQYPSLRNIDFELVTCNKPKFRN